MEQQQKSSGSELNCNNSNGAITESPDARETPTLNSRSPALPSASSPKGISDILQHMRLLVASKTDEGASETPETIHLSESEAEKYQQLLGLGFSVGELREMLNKRAQKPQQPAFVVPKSSEEALVPCDKASIFQAFNEEIRQNLADAAEKSSLENIQQQFLELLPAIPRKVRRKSTKEKRPAAPRNRNPKFNVPEWINKAPPITQKLNRDFERNGLPVAAHEQLLGTRTAKGMRKSVRIERQDGLTAYMHCVVIHTNLTTLKCSLNGAGIAKKCGLSRSQASRISDEAVQAGYTTKTLTRDANGHYRPMEIHITPFYFELSGISRERLATLQKQHQRYSKPANRKISKVEKAKLTATKVVQSAARAVAHLKEALRLGVASADKLKCYYTEAVIRLSDEWMKKFSLGRYASNFSTA